MSFIIFDSIFKNVHIIVFLLYLITQFSMLRLNIQEVVPLYNDKSVYFYMNCVIGELLYRHTCAGE